MEEKTNKFEAVVAKVNDALKGNKYLDVLKASFSTLTLVFLIGSLFSLLTSFPIQGYLDFIDKIGLKSKLSLVYTYTYNYISLYLVFLVAYNYCVRSKMRKHAISVGIIAITSFLLVAPEDNVLGTVGTTAMFTAVIIGFVVAKIYEVFVTKNMMIQLPDSVPPAVSTSFSAMIPGIVICLLMALINYGISFTSYACLNDIIYAILRVPLNFCRQNIIGELVIDLFMVIAWCFGIHGALLVIPINSLIFTAATAENLAAAQAGTALPNMITGPFTVIGASYLSMVLAALVFSKSESVKSVAKVSFVPAVFTIWEPFLFGMPVVMNPILCIPFILQMVLPILSTRALQAIGFLGYYKGYSTPLALPNIFKQTLNFGWKGVLVYVVTSVLVFFMWAPFIKMNDRMNHKEEIEGTKAAEEA